MIFLFYKEFVFTTNMKYKSLIGCSKNNPTWIDEFDSKNESDDDSSSRDSENEKLSITKKQDEISKTFRSIQKYFQNDYSTRNELFIGTMHCILDIKNEIFWSWLRKLYKNSKESYSILKKEIFDNNKMHFDLNTDPYNLKHQIVHNLHKIFILDVYCQDQKLNISKGIFYVLNNFLIAYLDDRIYLEIVLLIQIFYTLKIQFEDSFFRNVLENNDLSPIVDGFLKKFTTLIVKIFKKSKKLTNSQSLLKMNQLGINKMYKSLIETAPLKSKLDSVISELNLFLKKFKSNTNSNIFLKNYLENKTKIFEMKNSTEYKNNEMCFQENSMFNLSENHVFLEELSKKHDSFLDLITKNIILPHSLIIELLDLRTNLSIVKIIFEQMEKILKKNSDQEVLNDLCLYEKYGRTFEYYKISAQNSILVLNKYDERSIKEYNKFLETFKFEINTAFTEYKSILKDMVIECENKFFDKNCFFDFSRASLEKRNELYKFKDEFVYSSHKDNDKTLITCLEKYSALLNTFNGLLHEYLIYQDQYLILKDMDAKTVVDEKTKKLNLLRIDISNIEIEIEGLRFEINNLSDD